MSRSIPVMAVIAILAVAAIGTGYAYTAVYTQDLGSAEVKVSYIEANDIDSSSTSISFSVTGHNVGACYIDFTYMGVTSTGYATATYNWMTYSAKIVDGTAKFIAIPYVTGVSSITLGGLDGGSLSEFKVYEVKEVSS